MATRKGSCHPVIVDPFIEGHSRTKSAKRPELSRLGQKFCTRHRSGRVKALGIATVNAARLNEAIHATSVWGAAHRYGPDAIQTGIPRLALSDDDATVRTSTRSPAAEGTTAGVEAFQGGYYDELPTCPH
ncbi:hypothetical protein K439DRAFT_873118 [Ramaria rubella]|nr:hypothetical protein K439DRAFT_873118 [Ramaria rubella]